MSDREQPDDRRRYLRGVPWIGPGEPGRLPAQAPDTPGDEARNGHNGVQPPGQVGARPIPLRPAQAPEPDLEDEELDEALDLVAVQADDELINALAAGMSVTAPGHSGYDADDKVVAMLAAWKAEVEAEPVPELVDTDRALAAIREGVEAEKRSARRPRRRFLVPVAAAAALVVFSFGGVSLGAQNAQPGDALFGVTKVLYSEKAESREAAVQVKQRIEQVNQKIAAGDTSGAQQDLASLQPLMEKVAPEEGKTYLAAEQTFLAQKISETPPNTPTDPSAPLRDGTPRPKPPATEGRPERTTDSSVPVTSSSPQAPSSTGPTVDPRVAGVPASSSSQPTHTRTRPSTSPSSSAGTPTPSTEGTPETPVPSTPTTSAVASPTAAGASAAGGRSSATGGAGSVTSMGVEGTSGGGTARSTTS